MTQEEKCLTAFMQRVDGFFKPVPNNRWGENQFDVDFAELKQLSATLKQSTEKEYLSAAGYIAENRKKNRYKDIVPFDATRVKLAVTLDDPNSDYINASFIKGAENHKNYIASQGPLPHTVLDFWQMLWQYNVSVIVMVCREIELGKKKCERYWASEGETKTFGAITVTSERDETLNEGYSIRVIKAVNGQETRSITQFHYTSWPDHGVPKTCYEILSLINHVREMQSYSLDVDSPLCVHCSAGCGRTGAVVVVDFVRNLLDKQIVPADLKTFDIISKMRMQRPAIVQTKEQYEFVNVAIAELFKVYIRTRTLSREEFSTGYQGEEYVNINICSDSKARKKDSAITQYENFEPRARPNGTANPASADLNDSPPPKPQRPPSSIGLSTNNPYANYNQKQDTRNRHSPMQKTTPSTKPRGSQKNGNPTNLSPVRSSPTTPTAEPGKPRLPVSNKPITKSSIPKIVSPAESQEMKNVAPPKPKRSPKPLQLQGRSYSEDSAPNFPMPPDNFQSYPKKRLYYDVELTKSNESVPGNQSGNNFQSYQKNNVYNEVDVTNQGRRSLSSPLPPTVPVKTRESHILLDVAPPAVPERTEDSYCLIEGTVTDTQAYESFDSKGLSANSPENHDSGRRHSAVSSLGNAGIKTMMATVVDKTANAFAKVGATISKTGDDASTGISNTTLEDRKPTYTQEPTIYNGQDMSFGRRLMKKVRGPRKQK